MPNSYIETEGFAVENINKKPEIFTQIENWVFSLGGAAIAGEALALATPLSHWTTVGMILGTAATKAATRALNKPAQKSLEEVIGIERDPRWLQIADEAFAQDKITLLQFEQILDRGFAGELDADPPVSKIVYPELPTTWKYQHPSDLKRGLVVTSSNQAPEPLKVKSNILADGVAQYDKAFLKERLERNKRAPFCPDCQTRLIYQDTEFNPFKVGMDREPSFYELWWCAFCRKRIGKSHTKYNHEQTQAYGGSACDCSICRASGRSAIPESEKLYRTTDPAAEELLKMLEMGVVGKEEVLSMINDRRQEILIVRPPKPPIAIK